MFGSKLVKKTLPPQCFSGFTQLCRCWLVNYFC